MCGSVRMFANMVLRTKLEPTKEEVIAVCVELHN
jgi:hypothetical protein